MMPELAFRTIKIKENVEEFIMNGADLMWPGIL